MSYILDALKRADAERERGTVPGLHARQATGPAFQTTRSMQQRAWMAAALLALAGLAATSLWLWQRPDAAVRRAAVESAVPRPLVPLAQPGSVLLPMPIPATPAAAAAPSAPQPAPAASRPVPSARAAPTPAQPRPKPDPVARPASSQSAPPAVRPFSELSEDLRRQIPPLAITGSVYSQSPDKRLLLVNNQVLAQGNLAAPEVTLEEIQAKSSVFSFRGVRFRVVH